MRESFVHVDLVEKVVLHDTRIAALYCWRNGYESRNCSMNQILPTASAGGRGSYSNDSGGKAQAIQTWIRSILRKIVRYKAEEHQRLVNEAAATFEFELI